jgi:hypothetical protein
MNIRTWLVLALLIPITAHAQNDLRTLMPRPRVAFEKPGEFILSASTLIVVPVAPDTATTAAINYLRRRINEKIGLLPTVITSAAYHGESGAILLGFDDSSNAAGYPALIARLKSSTPRMKNRITAAFQHTIDIAPDLIIVAGVDGEAIFNGVATLAQLMNASGSTARLHAAHIIDYPEYPVRWVFSQHNLRGNGAISNLRRIADTMAAYKLNGLQQNDFKYNILESQPPNYFDSTRALDSLTRARNVELIPGVANIGWSSGILWHDPNLAEGFPARVTYVVEADTARLIPDPRVSLPNGNFEATNGSGKFTGWRFYDEGSVSVDKTIFHSGTSSAKCTNFIAGNASGNCRFNRRVDCQPNRYYVMSAWVRTESFKGDEIRLLAIGQDDAGGSRSLTYTAFSLPTTTSGWQKIEVAFNTLEFNHVQLYAGVWGGRSGTIWWDDFTIIDGGLTNVLRRGGTPLHIYNKTGGLFECIEGSDFASVVDPALLTSAGEFGPYHTPPTLRILGSRVRNGDTLTVTFHHPLATVNDLQGNGSVMVCVSEPKLYDILADQITRVDSLYSNRGATKSWFLGHDEIRAMNRDSACLSRSLSPGALLADNLTRCIGIIDSISPGAKSYVWSDMFDSLHNAHADYYLINGDLSGDWNLIPKSVTIVNWNGGASRDKSLAFFANKGFHQITSPYYDVQSTANIRAWWLSMGYIENIDGMMYTTWNGDYSFLRPFSYYAWGAGPYIIHTPPDAATIAAMKRGDTITFMAIVLPDPFDPTDSIESVRMIMQCEDDIGIYTMLRTSGDTFTVRVAFTGGILCERLDYSIEAHNRQSRQGPDANTPTYVIVPQYLGVNNEPNYQPTISLHIEPNPAHASIVAAIGVPTGKRWHLRLVNALGETVATREGVAASDQSTLVIDASAFPSGIYRCELRDDTGGATTEQVGLVH